MHRDGIRPRPIDDGKPLKVIRNLLKEKENMSPEEKLKFATVEEELQGVIDNFSRIKSIVTPQYQNLLINKNNNLIKNEKNAGSVMSQKNTENSNNLMKESLNNEKEISNSSSEQTKANTHVSNKGAISKEKGAVNSYTHNEKDLNFELKKYKRPSNYIVYSTNYKEERDNNLYEAPNSTYIFLNYHDNFMTVEELEKCIVEFEKSIGHNNDKLNQEKAVEIIKKLFPRFEKENEKIMKLIKFYNDEREENKMSLIRKFWREQKYSDKNLRLTFSKREREKMKTRKNNQNKTESLNKLKEDKKLCNSDIRVILQSMDFREELRIEEVNLQKLDLMRKFASENHNGLLAVDKIEQSLGGVNVIKEIEKIGGMCNSINSFLNEEEKRFKTKLPSEPTVKQQPKRTPAVKPVKDESVNASNNSINTSPSIPQKSPSTTVLKPKKFSMELDTFLRCINEYKNKLYNSTPKKTNRNRLRFRIRIGRFKKHVIDRYVQRQNGFDIFDDDFNKEFEKYKCVKVMDIKENIEAHKYNSPSENNINNINFSKPNFTSNNLLNSSVEKLNSFSNLKSDNSYIKTYDFNLGNNNSNNYENYRPRITFGEKNNFDSLMEKFNSGFKEYNNILTDLDNELTNDSDVKILGQNYKQFIKQKRALVSKN